MRASFAGGGPRTLSAVPAAEALAVAGARVEPPAAAGESDGLTTRERIVHMSRPAIPEAPAAARIVDIQERRGLRPVAPSAPPLAGATVLPFRPVAGARAAEREPGAPVAESAGATRSVEALGAKPARPPPTGGEPPITAAPADQLGDAPALTLLASPAAAPSGSSVDDARARAPPPSLAVVPEPTRVSTEFERALPKAASEPPPKPVAAPAADTGGAAGAREHPEAAAPEPAGSPKPAESPTKPTGDATPARAAGTVPTAASSEASGPRTALRARAAAPQIEGGPAPGGPESEATAGEAATEPAPAEDVPREPVVIRDPEDDPGFQAMTKRTRRAARVTKTHQLPDDGVATAKAAAEAPKNELEARAAEAQVGVMSEKEPGEFNEQAFIDAVEAAIKAATPATLENVEDFEGSGKVGQATAGIHGSIKGGKQSSANDIQTATAAPPRTDGLVPKPEADMVNDEPGARMRDVGAGDAMPAERPQEHTDLSAGPAKVDAEMATANVTDEQIARSNEPDFNAAIDARQQAREHAATAPEAYRTDEQTILSQGGERAAGSAVAELGGMHGARSAALGKVLGEKEGCKGTHEAEEARVANDIEAMYKATKFDVQEILKGLDKTVDDEFTLGETAARTSFEKYVGDCMRAYKSDRYGPPFGAGYWIKDKFCDLPDYVNRFYDTGRTDYLAAMRRLIVKIAGIVVAELTAAKARIVEGKAKVRVYVKSLADHLQGVGERTAGKLERKFDELTSEVEAKQDELVDAVARRYIESRDALDARIEELKAANKGLVSRALDAVVGVIKTILALGEMLLRVLARAAEVVGDIISDPIGFLTNLIDGVMGGLKRFVKRIKVHLQNALFDWLFGTLGEAGITMPKQLDGAGVLDLVTQVMGLTYASVRARVARIVGEPVVEKMEQTVDVFKTLKSVGIGGLWEFVKDQIPDIEGTVLGKIKEYVIERVIKGGIEWILGLLNPVSAFIKACKAIYSIVMFIADRAKQIMDFVNAILDSISAIAKGDIGTAVEKVESALAKGLSLAIGFLASLLNLGNIAKKVKSIIATVRRPIERAIDGVVMGTARAFKRTLGGAAGFVKGKVAAGKEWAKGKVEAGKAWAQERATAVKDRVTGRKPTREEPSLEPDPLAERSPPGPLVIDEDFRSDGRPHEIYTVPGREELLIASDPTPLTDIIDPGGEIAVLNAEYLTARSDYELAATASRNNPDAVTGWTVLRDKVTDVVRRIVARVKVLGLEEAPGASAPGLGAVGWHGQKPSSLRNGPRIWWTESEHILPFAIGKNLWDAVGELIPGRKGSEDNRQTTVMIYEHAAEQKTVNHDTAAIAAFDALYLNLSRTARAFRQRALQEGSDDDESGPGKQFENVYFEVIREIVSKRDSAVVATNNEIAAEHATSNQAGVTHGARRGEPIGLPDPAKIESAAMQQYTNILELAAAAVREGRARRRGP